MRDVGHRLTLSRSDQHGNSHGSAHRETHPGEEARTTPSQRGESSLQVSPRTQTSHSELPPQRSSALPLERRDLSRKCTDLVDQHRRVPAPYCPTPAGHHATREDRRCRTAPRGTRQLGLAGGLVPGRLGTRHSGAGPAVKPRGALARGTGLCVRLCGAVRALWGCGEVPRAATGRRRGEAEGVWVCGRENSISPDSSVTQAPLARQTP